MKKSPLVFLLLLTCFSLYSQVIPMMQAHSHNDYNQERPLLDALGQGFTSVEADILYIYGELFIGHNMPDSANHNLPILTKSYLRPLYDRFKANNGEIYPDYKGDFYLWIDIKFESWKAYRKLKQELLPFKEMLNYWEEGKHHPGKVTVILSGERPFELVKYDRLRLVTLDGRLDDLQHDYSSAMMPFISMNRRDIFKLDAEGNIPSEELEKLVDFAKKCFEQGKKTRLWAIPEEERIWQQLLDAGIDLINTDDLDKLRQFLNSR